MPVSVISDPLPFDEDDNGIVITGKLGGCGKQSLHLIVNCSETGWVPVYDIGSILRDKIEK
jgi:hypothetical protein